ncbi:hypothetical protein H5410_062302 [Solanum commersonii]|uniref:Uncharacterized protein n=1 Tax=Solanum commersonii TaxID=4109 RepID=A0A9J5WBX3_SOLCO|nr:hypothetical protein H5410_062302 [Solanum commersonii]
MDKFLIKLPKPKDGQPSSSSNQPFVSSQVAPEDPKDRMPISSYGPNIEMRMNLKVVEMPEIHLQEMVLGVGTKL